MKEIIKKEDNRKVLAIGYYYSSGSGTQGKQIKSCIKAGYTPLTAERDSTRILGLDGFTPEAWHNLNNLLPLCTNKLKLWLDTPNKDLKSKDIREILTLIRLIGDSVGKFIKREMKLTESKEEKHIYHHFDNKEDEIKYYKELTSISNKKLKEINE